MRVSIPYVSKSVVFCVRFRALHPAIETKYMGLTSAETRMYNVIDVENAKNFIGVCE